MHGLIAASILASAVLHLASASVAIGKAQVHPEHPGKCYLPDENIVKVVGSKWNMKDACGQITCESMSGSMYLAYSMCPMISMGDMPGCHLQEDKARSFPDCCPRIVCPEAEQPQLKNIHDLVMTPNHQAAGEPRISTYDATLPEGKLDYRDYEDSYNYIDDNSGYSNVFPLWRDFGRESSLGIDDEEAPNYFSPRR